jgi:DNA primase
MAWQIMEANVDFVNSRAVVNFADTSGISSVQVTFLVAAANQTKDLDFRALIAQAKQIATDATKNAPDAAAIIRKGPKR